MDKTLLITVNFDVEGDERLPLIELDKTYRLEMHIGANVLFVDGVRGQVCSDLQNGFINRADGGTFCYKINGVIYNVNIDQIDFIKYHDKESE